MNFRIAFWACVGPPLGVGVNPAGEVRTIGEDEAAIVVVAPKRPSMATMSGLMALLPQSPGKSPLDGMTKPIFSVEGSVTFVLYGFKPP